MLPAGDGEGRTQQGNNNAYCQDNPLSWVGWDYADGELAWFTRRMIAVRRSVPALRRARWFEGTATPVGDLDLVWLWRDGTPMTPARWDSPDSECFGFMIGRFVSSEPAVIVLINGSHDGGDVTFTLPPSPGLAWRRVIDSARPVAPEQGVLVAMDVGSRSVTVLVTGKPDSTAG